jgi:hypothetical protein
MVQALLVTCAVEGVAVGTVEKGDVHSRVWDVASEAWQLAFCCLELLHLRDLLLVAHTSDLGCA